MAKTRQEKTGQHHGQDTYRNLVNSPLGKSLAGKLGLPRPVALRRYQDGQVLLEGPALLLGAGRSAQAIADTLVSWGVDVRTHADAATKLAAIVAVIEELTEPAQLSEFALQIGSYVRQLGASGRVVLLYRSEASTPTHAATASVTIPTDPVAEAAARYAVSGFARSLAHELRFGATANAVAVDDGVRFDAPSVLGSLRFFLSSKSAYVDGQFLRVKDEFGALPRLWDRPLEGRTALVTGAARGIGRTIAAILARDGANVVVLDVPLAGQDLTAAANAVGGTAIQADITAVDTPRRVADLVTARYQSLDILVHNAGITQDKLLANMSRAQFERVLQINLISQLEMTRAFEASGLLSANAHLVSLASTSGIAGNRGQTNYAASKAGIMGMVRAQAAAAVQAGQGRTYNAVAPGFIETEMTAKMPRGTREVARRLNSLHQGGLPVDVAEAVAFLASDAAGGITGEVLRVCGQNLVGA